jgi:CHAT domain-containing protein
MAGIGWRIAGLGLAAALIGQPAHAQRLSPLAAESFRIGSEGALCEAQGVRLGAARSSVFDRKWALICRDVDRPIGAAYSWRGGERAQPRVDPSDEQADCAAPAASDAAPSASVRRCRDRATGLEWVSYTATAGGWRHLVEGFAAFDGALRLALRSLVEDREVPGSVDVVTTGNFGSLAEALRATGEYAQLIGQGYRRNNAGEYAEAEEFFRPGPADAAAAGGDATLAERQHEALVNRALQLSNLGHYDEAARLFEQARGMALRDGIQARLLRNFEAIDALNQNRLEEVATILARPVPALEQPILSTAGQVVIDPGLSSALNSGLAAGLTDTVAQETRLTRAERAAIIDAQARQLAGTSLRLQGRNEEALAQLAAARDAILAVREGRVLSTARLQAQALSEMGLADEALGRFADAEGLLGQALQLTQLRYPGSASVSAAQARLAAFLARRGRQGEALALYGRIVEEVKNQRGALVGLENQLEPYFEMLVNDPARVNELFLASQLIERPGAAQTLAQLARQLSAGNSEASSLYRRANALDRELARVNLAIAQANAQPSAPAPLTELQDRRMRLEQSQLELFDALAAFPAFRSISHDYVAADDLRAMLRPGEGYLKLVRLGDAMFAVFISPTRSLGWRVKASASEIGDLVSALRDSISLSIGGQTATYPFDVDSSQALYQAVFAPVAADLAGLKHLVFEPDGAFLQLPINLLATDPAGVAAYHQRVAAGGDEFDFRGISWLGRGRAISTALSAASFRDARRAPSSKAGRAYLGLGQNLPVTAMSTVARTRSASSVEAGCEIPLAAWNQPIPADELVLAAQTFGPARSNVITGAAFTDTAIEGRGDLDNYRIVHFATHGLVTAPAPGCPANPALLTSFGRAGSDGLLRFAEIFDLDLDADLVILSACDTAGTAGVQATAEAGIEGGGGQALDGLVRAFIGAGGRQVIASHWPAPEEFGATKRLFSSFFASPPGASVGDALRAAQQQLMDDAQTSHPFYWSGFALIGDGERPLFSGS